LVFTEKLEPAVAAWLSEKFVELIAAPGMIAHPETLKSMLVRRRNLKAVDIRRFGEMPVQSTVAVPGGKLTQTTDVGLREDLRSVTKLGWPESKKALSYFGIAVCRSLKSNAIALVREIPGIQGASQLVGAGQGQPNRIEALKALAVPRARGVMGADLKECIMISDAFFPFRDTVDTAFDSGLRYIIQPGGSLKDSESIAACDEHGVAMAFTGIRHFKH
jgi:phosphoribosylaminoimidazolecarboxamide formyltransferase / IMP cyclohydrolase